LKVDLAPNEQDASVIAQESEIPQLVRDLVMAHRTAIAAVDVPAITP
jgi:hypothetical protein